MFNKNLKNARKAWQIYCKSAKYFKTQLGSKSKRWRSALHQIPVFHNYFVNILITFPLGTCLFLEKKIFVFNTWAFFPLVRPGWNQCCPDLLAFLPTVPRWFLNKQLQKKSFSYTYILKQNLGHMNTHKSLRFWVYFLIMYKFPYFSLPVCLKT